MTIPIKSNLKEIIDAEPAEVSLVDRPANQVPFLLIKSAGGAELKLPLDAAGILELVKSLGDAGAHLTKLSGFVAGAVSEEGATFPESLTEEITKAVALLGDRGKPAPVEKPAAEEDPSSLEKNLDPITAFMVTVQAIREKLWDVRDSLEASPTDALVAMQQVTMMLQNAITSYPSAIASSGAQPSALAMAADDLAKCHAGLPPSDVAEVQEAAKLLKQLEVAIRPSSAIQKSFDEYRSAAEAREVALQEQNQRLRKALVGAVALVRNKVTPLAKAAGMEPRPAPQSTPEGVLSLSTPNAAQPPLVHWGTDLAEEVAADERAAAHRE